MQYPSLNAHRLILGLKSCHPISHEHTPLSLPTHQLHPIETAESDSTVSFMSSTTTTLHSCYQIIYVIVVSVTHESIKAHKVYTEGAAMVATEYNGLQGIVKSKVHETGCWADAKLVAME